MSHKIQITVDDTLNDVVKRQAHKMGLSVSSFSRYALREFLMSQKKIPLLDSAMADVKAGRVEPFDVSELDSD